MSDLFSRFRVLRFLGGPPFDTVCLAHDRITGTSVVLRLLPHDTTNISKSRLNRLEKLLESLQEEQVQGIPAVGAFDLDSHPSGYTEEYVPGEPLSRLITRTKNKHRQLSFPFVVTTLRRLADILKTTHRTGLFHGDLRPQQILLQQKRLHILSFPWAPLRPFPEHLVKELSLAYLPPEGLDGERPDPCWDMYQLGLTAYSMFAGHRPFPALRGIDAARARCVKSIPPLGHQRPFFPRILQDIVMTLLAKDPSERFQTAGSFLKELDAYLAASKKGRLETVPVERPKARSTTRNGKDAGTDSEDASDTDGAEPFPESRTEHTTGTAEQPAASDSLSPEGSGLETAELSAACIIFILSTVLFLSSLFNSDDNAPLIVQRPLNVSRRLIK